MDPSTLTRALRQRLIRGFIFLKEKFLANGEFDKLKARLVAGGHMQDKSSYVVEEIASPTVSLQSVFMTATLAALEGRHVMTLDVGSAYLNANMAKNVFMAQDSAIVEVLLQINPEVQQFRRVDGSIIVKLKKTLMDASKVRSYGTPTSPTCSPALVSSRMLRIHVSSTRCIWGSN